MPSAPGLPRRGWEQKYLDLFLNKYNINPASSSRLGSKHSDETKALFSKINKENPRFLNKTFSYEVLEEMRKRMYGSLNPMYGKPVSDANKKLIYSPEGSGFISKRGLFI